MAYDEAPPGSTVYLHEMTVAANLERKNRNRLAFKNLSTKGPGGGLKSASGRKCLNCQRRKCRCRNKLTLK